MEYHPQTAKFRGFELDFGARPELRKDPASCHSCHRRDLRPNWEPYDAWPGTFGTVHDTVVRDSPEASWYANIRKQAAQHPRLKFLPHLANAEADPSVTDYTLRQGIAANGGFSILLGFLNHERITDRLLASPLHEQYRQAILAALLDCQDDIRFFLPKEILANHPKTYEAVLFETRRALTLEEKRRVRLSAQHLKMPKEHVESLMDHYGMREAEVRRTARLRFLLENRREHAVDMEAWTTTLTRGSYAFNDGASGLENLIGHYAPRAFIDQPNLLAILPYRTVPFAITSYDGRHLHAGAQDVFALELFERAGDPEPICQQFILTHRPASHK